jgi:hypothetical protein
MWVRTERVDEGSSSKSPRGDARTGLVTGSLHPVVTADLLATIARLKFRVTTRDAAGTKELGVLVDRPAHKTLMIQAAEGGAREWTLGIAPPGTPAFLLTRDTYDVLRVAAAGGDGELTHQGKRFRLKANDGETPHVAEIVPG